MNFKAYVFACCFGVWTEIVIKNIEQALVTFDVGVVAGLGVVTTIPVHVDKRREVLCIVTFAMGWPGEDVFGNFIASLAMMGDEVVDFLAGEVPDVMIL